MSMIQLRRAGRTCRIRNMVRRQRVGRATALLLLAGCFTFSLVAQTRAAWVCCGPTTRLLSRAHIRVAGGSARKSSLILTWLALVCPMCMRDDETFPTHRCISTEILKAPFLIYFYLPLSRYIMNAPCALVPAYVTVGLT